MLKESGAPNVEYDYFSTNGQMARVLKGAIKEKKRLGLALELLSAVNHDAFDRGIHGKSEEARPVVKGPETIQTRFGEMKRVEIWCPRHNRKEFRYRRS